MDFICCMSMAPALKGGLGFAVVLLKGIYYTKDVEIQRESKFPNTESILGERESEPEAASTRHFLGAAAQEPLSPSPSWGNPWRTQSGPLFQEQLLKPPLCLSYGHLGRPPEGWADGFSLVPFP